MGARESATTLRTNISRCVKNIENDNHNFQNGASLLENFTWQANLYKLKIEISKPFCKMSPFFIKVTNNVVTIMELKEVSFITNMSISKDADDVVSQHNWKLFHTHF